MLILLRTQVERTAKAPIPACHARVGSLCDFQDTVERVPAGSLKTGRCANVREHCGHGKRRKRTAAGEFRQREKPQAASRRKSSSSASSTAIRSSSSSRSSPASLARSPTSPRSQRPWETSKKFDIGFDLSLINRIHLTFDYYNEETSDALFEVPLSMTTGMSTVYQNIGAIRNRGIEASINASVINNNNLTWNIYANMTWNKNKIIKLSTDEPIEYTYQIIEEGRPYRQFYMKEYAGVDRENGKPLWYLNEEGNETTSDYNAAAKRYVGDADPKVLGGFGTNLSWKGFDFNMNFTYRLGGKVFDSGASFTGFGMANRTPLKDVALNSWTEENKDAKYPQYIYGDPNKATQTSSRFLYSSNFLRISNMTLGYTVPVNLTKKIFIQKLRAYISIDNLYTFTSNDFVGYNPETYSNGVIAWQYPATRTFIGGIQLSF